MFSSRRALLLYNDDRQMAVGAVRVAAAVTAFQLRMKIRDPVGNIDKRRLLQISHEFVAFEVNVGVDAVVWLTPALRSKVADPSQSGRPSSSNLSECQRRT